MPVPNWVHKWIEQLDDPIQDAVMLNAEEDRLHTSWCMFRANEDCNCRQEYHETGNESNETSADNWE